MITDDSISHHWSHSAIVFFISALLSRFVKVLIIYDWIGVQQGAIFACVCLLIALGYWLFWFLSELNEVIPRENHRNLFLRRRFDWRVIIERVNFFELTYRLSVFTSIFVGFFLGGYQ